MLERLKDRLMYTFLKLCNLIVGRVKLSKYRVSSNLFFIKNKDMNSNKILLYLNNSYFAHMGDILFFEPLLKFLNTNKINIDICVPTVMNNYFYKLGYSVKEDVVFEEYEYIISRSDFYYVLKNKGNLLLVQTTNLYDKLCYVIINEIAKFFDLPYVEKKAKISKFTNFNEINNIFIVGIEKDENKYIIYSNYIDSGAIFFNSRKFKLLRLKCLELKKKGYKIIHVGTHKDKQNDKKKYSFIDIDLRGKTTVEELFYLVNLDNVHEYVGMDNFVMHLFFIYNKKVNVCIRTKGSKNRRKEIEKFVNPPFYVNELKLKYLAKGLDNENSN